MKKIKPRIGEYIKLHSIYKNKDWYFNIAKIIKIHKFGHINFYLTDKNNDEYEYINQRCIFQDFECKQKNIKQKLNKILK